MVFNPDKQAPHHGNHSERSGSAAPTPEKIHTTHHAANHNSERSGSHTPEKLSSSVERTERIEKNDKEEMHIEERNGVSFQEMKDPSPEEVVASGAEEAPAPAPKLPKKTRTRQTHRGCTNWNPIPYSATEDMLDDAFASSPQ
eukprot:TRINITY_DN1211_c0_g1_i2.p1 TRINITY_DN1211_c0_g1~~TRINITY_DN1211_c0_g1_i2.p1  ORF type:complete len:143 (-),score=26.97 TRINITY_DN1211_c0_g1_i2:78-506(-)